MCTKRFSLILNGMYRVTQKHIEVSHPIKEISSKGFLNFYNALNKTKLMYILKNKRLKLSQLEKARFIKVNELKLSQIELF